MNNNPCIIFALECNPMLEYIWRVSDNTCSPPNEYPSEPRHHSNVVQDSCMGWVTL